MATTFVDVLLQLRDEIGADVFETVGTLAEELFLLQTLGDDRAVRIKLGSLWRTAHSRRAVRVTVSARERLSRVSSAHSSALKARSGSFWRRDMLHLRRHAKRQAEIPERHSQRHDRQAPH